jgi:hypothetical protein
VKLSYRPDEHLRDRRPQFRLADGMNPSGANVSSAIDQLLLGISDGASDFLLSDLRAVLHHVSQDDCFPHSLQILDAVRSEMLATAIPSVFRACARFFAQILDFFPVPTLDSFADEQFLTACVTFIETVDDRNCSSVCRLLSFFAVSTIELRDRLVDCFPLDSQLGLILSDLGNPAWSRPLFELLSCCCHFEIPTERAILLIQSLLAITTTDLDVQSLYFVTHISALFAGIDDVLAVFCESGFPSIVSPMVVRYLRREENDEGPYLETVCANLLVVAIHAFVKHSVLFLDLQLLPEVVADEADVICTRGMDLCVAIAAADEARFAVEVATDDFFAGIVRNVRLRSAAVKARAADLLGLSIRFAGADELRFVLGSLVLADLVDLLELADVSLAIHIVQFFGVVAEKGIEFGWGERIRGEFEEAGVMERLETLGECDEVDVALLAATLLMRLEGAAEDDSEV